MNSSGDAHHEGRRRFSIPILVCADANIDESEYSSGIDSSGVHAYIRATDVGYLVQGKQHFILRLKKVGIKRNYSLAINFVRTTRWRVSSGIIRAR